MGGRDLAIECDVRVSVDLSGNIVLLRMKPRQEPCFETVVPGDAYTIQLAGFGEVDMTVAGYHRENGRLIEFWLVPVIPAPSTSASTAGETDAPAGHESRATGDAL